MMASIVTSRIILAIASAVVSRIDAYYHVSSSITNCLYEVERLTSSNRSGPVRSLHSQSTILIALIQCAPAAVILKLSLSRATTHSRRTKVQAVA